MYRIIFSLFITVLFSVSTTAAALELELMSYNVENLFDTEHDAGKDDWTFLPSDTPKKVENCEKISAPHYKKECLETDWTEKKLALKLRQIKRVIDARSKLPHFLALSEVENENVVKQLADLLGYDGVVVTDSPDERGVDVALLYKSGANVEFLGYRELEIKHKDLVKPTRNILEAEFVVGGDHRLNIYVNHWPSQGAPTETRLAVAREVKKLIKKAQTKDRGLHIIAAGDFNVVDREIPNPISDVMLSEKESGFALYDVDTLFWDYHVKNKSDYSTKWTSPPGSYFYPPGMQWNRLDKFLVSENLVKGKKINVQPESYEIFAPPMIRRNYTYDKDYFAGTVVNGIPNGYNHNSTDQKLAGFSDHFPIVVSLSVN